MSDNIHSSLVHNGLDFVVTALASVKKTGNGEREIKYGVLHIWSGVQLLLKERIRREHWTLLFANPAKVNLKAYEAGDFQSVQYDQIEHILKEVCGIEFSDIEKKSLDRLRKKRNQIEHFSFEVNVTALKGILARVLHLLVSFVDDHLTPDEFDLREKELFENLKEEMRSFEEFVKVRLTEVAEKLKDYSGKTLFCTSCENQTAVRVDDEYKCRFCLKSETDFSNQANTHLENVLSSFAYIQIKDGGEWPQYECFDCGEEAFIPVDREHSSFFCVACMEVRDSEDVMYCSSCGVFCEEDELTLCGDCIDNRLAAD